MDQENVGGVGDEGSLREVYESYPCYMHYCSVYKLTKGGAVFIFLFQFSIHAIQSALAQLELHV